MKKIFLLIPVLLFSVCSFAQIEEIIPSKPNPPRLVNDFTGNFLTTQQRDALEAKLVAYDDSTSNQIAVVIVSDLRGYDANTYATALGRKWGVGGKEFNNGIVVLISTGGGEGNRDAYIAVGYGLEGAIPDITAGYIVDKVLIPNFKEGNYYRGLDEATDAIIKAAAGEYKAPAGYHKKGKPTVGNYIGVIFFILIVLFFIIAGRGGTGGGGGFGAGWIIGSMMGGGRGWSGGGGGWSGGGGGFGGFGGGGFGGGGAGGKW